MLYSMAKTSAGSPFTETKGGSHGGFMLGLRGAPDEDVEFGFPEQVVFTRL